MGIISALKYYNANVEGFNVDQFAALIEKAYTDDSQAGFKQKTSFSPSTVGGYNGTCPRYWYYAFNGVDFEDTADAAGKAKMLNGTYVHDRLQKLLEKTGTVKYVELEVKNQDPPIRGFIDVIIDYYGEEVPGEIKSTNTETFVHRSADMKPTGAHLVQTLIYMKLRGAKNGFVLYEDKNDQSIVVIPVKMTESNEKYVEYLFGWMRDVYALYTTDQKPTRPYTKSQPACKYCPIKKTCWKVKDDDGVISHPKLEVPK